VDFRADESWRGVDELVDGILIRRDPHANTRGALEILGLAADSASGVPAILAETAAGGLRGLVVCGWSPEALGEAGREALERAEWACYVGPREVPGLEAFDLVLPTCVHVEREGTFTNHAGRVQRFQAALTPYEASRPAWRVFEDVRAGLSGAAAAATPAEAFARVAEAAPAFAGLSLEQVGDQGVWLRGYELDSTPPVGADPRPGVRAPNIG
jgi:NADH dehydrogenase/NADH:ubiquinone oxidoreductase subunit G